jgi:hypothetical protein
MEAIEKLHFLGDSSLSEKEIEILFDGDVDGLELLLLTHLELNGACCSVFIYGIMKFIHC